MEENTVTIHCLPDELIFLLLKRRNIKDIVNFGLTCKRYYQLINSNESFWGDKFKQILPDIYEVVKKYSSGSIVTEFKNFMKQKQNLHRELINLSPNHYWMIKKFGLEDMSYFFSIASANSLSYYYTIYLLHDVINKGNGLLNQNHSKKPYTLTEMHYAKIIVRYLIHCYLTVWWMKLQMNHCEMPPEMVLIFFLQWIDTNNFYCIDHIQSKLQEWSNIVKGFLKKKYPKQSVKYSDYQIFSAVSEVIFQQRKITISVTPNLETLDIIKVWENKVGHEIVIFIIYQALATRCGVKCEVVVFTKQLSIVWKHNEDQRHHSFAINIKTGDLKDNGFTSFGRYYNLGHFRYNAGVLLHNICLSFMHSIGSATNWTSRNASTLVGFLGGINANPSPYDGFYQYLTKHIDLRAINSELDIKSLTKKELRIIISMVHTTSNTHSVLANHPNNAVEISELKKHHSSVLYAVGMICRHRVFEYECIIRGWDFTRKKDRRSTISGVGEMSAQPYYHVVAADQSKRYIAQEDLMPVSNPKRLLQVEELIGKEFTHFDGFSYVLNDQKKLEYPKEGPIVDVFRMHYG